MNKSISKTAILIFIIIFGLISFSCKSSDKNRLDLYKKIDNQIIINPDAVILESTNAYKNEIKIIEKFGDAKEPVTGRQIFRDYVAYPYYSIKKFGSAIDCIISKIETDGEVSITTCSDNLEIEYFGMIRIDENLKVGDELKIGSYIGTMLGGGDSGMKLKIRMRYNGSIINPEHWFSAYEF